VCGFCFAQPEPGAVTEHEVSLTTSEPDEAGNRSYGMKLDDYTPPGASDATTIVTAITKESPNRPAVRIGDRILSIDGQQVAGGHEAAVPLLIEGAKRGEAVKCTLARPALLLCPGCKKLAACERCVGEGRMAWHAYECALYRALPPQAVQGETSTLRLLLRYKVSTEPKVGEWSAEGKEPISLLTSLQANACDVPPEQLLQLSKLTGNSSANVASLIYQVRTNAAEITRGGKKVGCALSVLMGWHNHDCAPNATAMIATDGAVTITAKEDVKEGDEINISYVDCSQPLDERRKVLQTHYGFECRCAKCIAEQRKELKSKMHQRDAYLTAQRR